MRRKVSRLSQGSYNGPLLVVPWVLLLTLEAVERTGDLDYMLIAGLALAYLAAAQMHLWYRAWESIQDEHARTTPAKAIGFACIPLFNLYWAFQFIGGFARDFNRYRQRQARASPRLSEGLFYVAATLWSSSVVFVFIPFVNLIYAAIAFVVALIVIAEVVHGVNAVLDEHEARETQAEKAAPRN